MLLVMITILMVQLQSFQRLFLVLATAPLALIGVAAALLISGAPMGFVAILGIVSLIGMVIRNSVILIDQIDTEIANGKPAWDAVIAATQHRLRPILLTAAAAILGMIPIAPDRVLGTDGLRGDGRTGCGNAAYAGVPARALRGVVPHPTGGSTDGQARELPLKLRSGIAQLVLISPPR